MSLKPYPKYKPSGIEWLGAVPAHWEVKAIKWLSPVQRGASPRPIEDPKFFDDEGEYAWVRISDVSSSDGVLHETTQRLSELGSGLSVKIHPNEIFISIAGTVGKPCISAIKACIHDGFVYFPRLKIPSIFLYRVFEAGVCYAGLGKFGTQLNLNTETIGSIRIALPPADELTSVINFLDYETSKIDTLIAEQEKLITLLTEKRQATISQAVTKGLDQNVPMKDSGVEWLGEVPDHWEVRRLKFCLRVLTEKAESQTNPVALENIEGWTGSLIETDTEFQGDGVTFEPNDILFGKLRPYLAKVYLAQEAGEAVGDFHVMRPMREIDPRFAQRQLLNSTFINIVDGSTYGSKMPRASWDFMANLPLLVPSSKEQTTIANFLDHEISKLDMLRSEAKKVIDLLKERRTALISAAVTGKIDVRGFSAPATK